ncbi:uncharacterized protein PGRI_028120 [Penicillium griseofulvum]|uniref:Uncharacterized protein n=1 Tax=Penicillium patulum TaxID=5078 RepID=A0A135LIZ5_PENPA|nr:uncharacterized protein PGRI_028120 [Penicillium griseofulvum]KXG48942.1 hypothetical protein PGRI_028120 [Penicillium griseofulvum]
MDTTKPSATDSPAIFVDEPLIGYNIQAAEQELGIPIHEDSRDRIPVIGPLSTDSIIPRPARAGVRPATRSNSRPNEGVYYVHRGKKIFQRFDDIEDEGEDEDDLGLFANRPDLLANNPDILKSVKPLRRADIKPRILFPLDVAPTNGGEEDVTDVEDHDDHEPMSPTPANEDEARLTPPILPDPATSESESLSFTPCAPVGYPGIVTQSAPVKHAGLHFTRSTPIEHTGRHFTRSTVGNVPPFQPDSFSEDLGFDTPADDQTRSRGLSTSSGSSLLKYWPPVSRKARGPEAPADRVKRLREARGSPAPRTRRAVRAEASGESSTAKPSTSDS